MNIMDLHKNKNKTKEELNIVVPTNWSGITLKKYLELQQDLLTYGEDDEQYFSTLVYHLCNIDPKYLKKIPSNIIMEIKNDLIGFMGNTEHNLQRIITIDGVKYGFEPDLSQMTYGAYLDITKFDSISIDKNWNKVMSILYRPLKSTTNKRHPEKGLYTIVDYTGKEDYTKFDNVGMDVHYGTYFFFVNLSTDLSNFILKSLMPKVLEKYPHILSTLEKNGADIHQLYNLLGVISKK